MKQNKTDLSVFNKFDFIYPPVGVKYLLRKPQGFEQLDKRLALCEMINESQQRGTPFYITKDNEDCAGVMMLGMAPPSGHPGGGELGVRYGIFDEARVNERLIANSPKMNTGAVKYVAFSPLNKVTFEPDLLFLVASTSQAEIVLRAMSYSTGEIWTSKVTPVGACSWLFVYPFQSGNVNYVPTGMTFGLKCKKVYPEGYIMFVIPYDWIPVIARNLEKMEWVLPAYTDKTRAKFMKRRQAVFDSLDRDFLDA